MARRTQKFTFVHILVIVAVMIWLPAVIGRLAGVPTDDRPEPPAAAGNSQTIDVESISHIQQQDSSPNESQQFRIAPAGLVLNETLISAAGKTAVINDQAFREGQLINQTGYPYRIRSILAGRVILEGDGGLYELRRQSLFE